VIKSRQVEVPLEKELAEELGRFWGQVFGESTAEFRGLLSGGETAHNRTTVHVAWQEHAIAGACYVTVSAAVPFLGGLGGVAVAPCCRRKGIATALCRAARDHFRDCDGRALFLATGNPAAARLYHRLGWRKLAGANVWANIAGDESPEEFLVDYFRDGGTASAGPAGPAERITMIPLLVTPHDWQILDANAGMLSTRYAVQASCMGLCPRYETVCAGGEGAWFSARTGDGRTVGMSTVRLDGADGAGVDGFTHVRFRHVWEELMERASSWAEARGARTLHTYCSAQYDGKRDALEELGFREAAREVEVELAGTRLACVRMEKTLRP